MSAHFREVPHVGVLIAQVASLPALLVAALAWPFGVLGDRIGHKRLLCVAAVFYGLVGTAPLWLPNLPSIVVSRGLVGVADAAIMSCSTTLIGAYFDGHRRGRYLALQTGTAPLMAITVIALGGALGEVSWRAPFAAYGFGFVLLPLSAWLLWEPRPDEADADRVEQASPATPFQWGQLLWICAVTLFAMTAFLVTVLQTGFLLTERGLVSPRLIGLWQGLASIANPLGAVLFGLLRWRSRSKLTLSFALLSSGFFLISLTTDWHSVVLGAAIANLGAGMILPTLITWAIGGLPAEQRGAGTGLWMASSFLGQYLSPLVVLALAELTGRLSGAILLYGIACAASALLAFICQRRPRSPVRNGARQATFK
jgi:MFS family permease